MDEERIDEQIRYLKKLDKLEGKLEELINDNARDTQCMINKLEEDMKEKIDEIYKFI